MHALRQLRSNDGLDELLWAIVYREGPLSKERLATLTHLEVADLELSLARLVDAKRVELAGATESATYRAGSLFVPVGAPVGWESEISFRGTADTVVPYAGGPSSPPGHPDMVNTLLGAVGTFEKWAALNQCTGQPSAEDTNGCSTYSTCEDGTAVTLCTTQGGGQVMGDANIAWNMLGRHTMP